jgi:NTP pyrophosphatase (non-canonical NTP hydrolase)
MNFRTYQLKASKTAIYPKKARIIYPVLGLANEAGEVLGVIKKQIRDHRGNFTDPRFLITIRKELGDVQWYLSQTAKDLGLSLEDIAESNINKLADRKKRGVLKGNGDNR